MAEDSAQVYPVRSEVNMAAETETLIVTLPIELVQHIRERVAAGDFASESDYIAHRFIIHQNSQPVSSVHATETERELEDQRRIVQHQRGETKRNSLDDIRKDIATLRRERLTA